MRNIVRKIHQFLGDADGLAMVEYAVIGSLIITAAFIAFQTLGLSAAARLDGISTDLRN